MDRSTAVDISATCFAKLTRVSVKQWGYGNVYQRGATWWIVYYVDGVRVRESSKSTDESVAKKLLKERLRRSDGTAARQISIGALLDNLIRDYRINDKSVNWVETVVRLHLRPAFGYLKAAKLGTPEIDRYTDKRLKEKAASGTINRELALLRRALYIAFESEPPLIARVPKFKLLDETAGIRKGFFELTEYERMVAALSKDIAPVLRFAYWTGCRRGEILNLRWSQFDEAGRIVRLEPGTTKNKEARTIPLSAELLEMFREMKRMHDQFWAWSPWIFSRAGARIRDFRGAWKNACEATGVNRLLHDARRSGVRNLTRAGVQRKIAKMISGHKTDSVFSRYQIVEEQDLHEAMQKLEKLHGADGETRTLTPSRAPEPKSGASANSATSAQKQPQKSHNVKPKS